MNLTRKKLATGVGMVLVAGGILLFAGAGTGLLNGIPAPEWAYAGGLLGGLPVALLGVIVGIRYGNLERYHKDYDEETGTIDSLHPFATFAEWISKDDSPQEDPPEKFVPSRWMYAALCYSPFVLSVGVLVWLDVPEFLVALASVLFFIGATVTFVVIDFLARQQSEAYP